MTPDLALPALLSPVLVAFIIEFDNEFEHRMPHRTTVAGGTGPWLASMAMWSTCMRFVGEEGMSAKELERLARTKTNLNGMVRWGYITIGADRLIRATAKGRKAQEVWRPLAGEIEQRWETRFGQRAVGRLRDSLRAIAGRIEEDLPDCLPILGYGLWSLVADRKRPAAVAREELNLPALLSRVLLAFAVEFERESEVSLAICANIVRVLDEKGVPVRELPRLSGVSKEAISVALGFLEKRGFAAGRTKIARLTSKGRAAQDRYYELLAAIEKRWQVRLLREALAPFANEALFRGLEPYPGGWRASVRKPELLPHYPMVLHRGGYPDGS